MQETNVQRCRNRSPTVATEDARMMRDPLPVTFTDVDRQVFQALVPAEYYLRQVSVAVDFERFRPHLATAYSPDQGRPAENAENPVRMLKLEFLRSQYGLSDRQVIERAETDAAFRWFLGLSELVRRHGARRARSRGQPKVLRQALLAAVATNVKHLVHLLRAPTMATAPA